MVEFSLELVQKQMLIIFWGGFSSKTYPNSKISMAEKTWDSQPKLSQTLKFPVACIARDSQPKLSPTPKFLVADKAHDS